MQSNISLKINGNRFEAWKSVNVVRAFDAVAGSFSLSLGTYDILGNKVINYLKIFQECTLYLENEIVITGYIDDISVSYSATSHTLSIKGRDKTADLVDCSAIHKPDEWHNVSVQFIANTLCLPFGIKANVQAETTKIKKFRIEQGETAFEALDRLCKMQDLFATSNPLGELILAKKSTAKASVCLEHGINILSANYTHSAKDLFSDYHIKGQEPNSDNKALKASLNDANIPRFRPLLFLAEDIASTNAANLRLKKEQDNRKAKSEQLNVSVQGWREHQSGTLWQPNKIVQFKDTMLGLNKNYFLRQVEYSFSEQGSTTNLILENV